MDNPYQPPETPNFTPPTTSGPVRPTVLTVFGILNIVFGSFGVLCTPLSGAALFIPQEALANAQGNPALAAMNNPGYRTFMIASIVLGTIASGVLLAAGIGLLKQRPWGRSLSIGYSIYALLAAAVGTFFSYTYLIAPMLAQAQQAGDPAAQGGAVGGAIGGLVGGCAGAIYPLLLLIFMNTATVKRVLGPKPPSGDPWTMPTA